MEETLYLSQYLTLTTAFERDPTPENESAIKVFLGKLVIKEYMPIKEKAIALVEILASLNEEFDLPGGAMYLEIYKVTKGLFRYCENLVDDASVISGTMGVYDHYQKYGLVKIIQSVCGQDYATLREMVADAVNISNIERMVGSAELLNNAEFDKWIDMMNELRETLTPEIVQDLVAIGHANSKEFDFLSKSIVEQALKEADKQTAALKIRSKMIQDDLAANEPEEAEEGTKEEAEDGSI